MKRQSLKIVCISDTHGLHHRMAHVIPDGDILLHAGDITRSGEVEDLPAVNYFFENLPHRIKIFVPGNHDWIFESDPVNAKAEVPAATCLIDSGIEFEGLKIWGSPWQPEFHRWAFNLPRGEALARVWSQIPEGTDIVITHGPPAGILDQCADGKREGCEDLAARIAKISPHLHLFGHIHEAYGHQTIGKTLYLNASICNLAYRPVNRPFVINLPESPLDSWTLAP
jgi:Icc-related predicted phosphoesterase